MKSGGCFDVSRCFPPFVVRKGPDEMNTSAWSSRWCFHFPLRNATLQVDPTCRLQWQNDSNVNKLCSGMQLCFLMAACGQTNVARPRHCYKKLWLLTHDTPPQPTPSISVLNWASTLGLTGNLPPRVEWMLKQALQTRLNSPKRLGYPAWPAYFPLKVWTWPKTWTKSVNSYITCN